MSDDSTPPQDPGQDPGQDPTQGPTEGAAPPPPPPPPAPLVGDVGAMPPPPPPPPPPAAASPYVGPPTAASGYSAVDAIQYGWNKFTKSPATLLIPVLITGVVVAVVYVLMFFVILGSAFSGGGTTIDSNGNFHVDNGPGFVVRMILMAVVFLAVMFVLQVLMAALAKGGLDVADGKSPAVGELFEGWDKGQVLIAAVLIAIGTAIGFALCYLPGIIFAFLASYTMYYIIDKQLSAVDAIKASISFTTSHLGETILFFLLSAVVTAIGGILCGLGLLIAYPVVLVGQAYTFRLLNNEPVTPAA